MTDDFDPEEGERSRMVGAFAIELESLVGTWRTLVGGGTVNGYGLAAARELEAALAAYREGVHCPTDAPIQYDKPAGVADLAELRATIDAVAGTADALARGVPRILELDTIAAATWAEAARALSAAAVSARAYQWQL